MPTPGKEFREALKAHTAEFELKLNDEAIESLTRFYVLLLRWNPRLHLVAPCSPREFALRHVLESLLLLKHLPLAASITDVGSGGGFPIIPCLLLRDDLSATLIESSPRKAVFLREALRQLNDPARVELIARRFQDISFPDNDFVTCRALHRFPKLLPALIEVAGHRTTFLLFGGESVRGQIQRLLPSLTVERIPRSKQRFLFIGQRKA